MTFFAPDKPAADRISQFVTGYSMIINFNKKCLGRTALALVLSSSAIVSAQNAALTLEQGFKNPPDSAKPRVWWHWMNGNITQEGIKRTSNG